MRINLKKFTFLLVFLIIYLLAFTSLAYSQMSYWVQAYDESAVYLDGSERIGEARGNTGWCYVMVNPVHVVNSIHINSLYMFRDWWQRSEPVDFTEIGWVKEYGWTNTYSYWAWSTAGKGYHGGPDGLIGPVSNGVNYSFKVAVDTGTTNWWWIIDGIKKYGPKALCKALWFGRGTPSAGSEKKIVNDTNYAHWWSMRLKRSQGDYRNWLDLRQLGDTDPNYRLNEISNTEFFVEAN